MAKTKRSGLHCYIQRLEQGLAESISLGRFSLFSCMFIVNSLLPLSLHPVLCISSSFTITPSNWSLYLYLAFSLLRFNHIVFIPLESI